MSFASVKKQVEYPDFLEIQIQSFKEFFQLETQYEKKKNDGLFQTFRENFPIYDVRNQFVLEFLDYFLDPPRYSISECLERGLTFSVSLKARMKISCQDPEHEDFKTVIQDVYLGTIPYMTPTGSFIINGAERVVVSQLHRSPGICFGQSIHANGTRLYSARVIPVKGSVIEFSTDINNVMYAYVDSKKKFPVTTLFRAIGYEQDQDLFYLFNFSEEVQVTQSNYNKLIGAKVGARVLKQWIEDFVDEDTGEVISIKRNEVILDRDIILEHEHIYHLIESGIDSVILQKKEKNTIDYIILQNTLNTDPTNSGKEALEHIYRQFRNSSPPDEETAIGVIEKIFFNRCHLGEVGRYRLNQRLGINIPIEIQVITKEDLIYIVKYILKRVHSKIDDMDNLSNRRVITVSEQLSAQLNIGLSRMARTIRDRMNVRDNEVFTPIDLINAKTLSSVINSFFCTSPLSQFMDQTNLLSEITHKRRLSSLGPGGLSRDRAGFEVRDVHYTHYGRLCPIETPEGTNIGLIYSLCVFAKVNRLGFIETPYRKVTNGQIDFSSSIYLPSEEESEKTIATAKAKVDEDGYFLTEIVISRKDGDFPLVEYEKIDYIDVGTNQIASLSASLIPFLEHDDANRALMGSNMMRQAVPLLCPESPIVGTGLEKKVATDSRLLINAEGEGLVEDVESDHISIRYNITEEEAFLSFDSNIKTYNMMKFKKTNQNTSIRLKPIVRKGMKVSKGQVLCEGYATEKGEIALGSNILVAFMPWKGFNFEDAFVLSERVVREDLFTSIHIDEYSLEVRDTKLGMEELTSDIPNLSEEATKNLDENGIIRVGSEVKPGDILIGKITPKGEYDPTPEEKLLIAIFGERAGNVKDASLKADTSLYGVVIDRKLFSRSIKDKKIRALDKMDIEYFESQYKSRFSELHKLLCEKLYILLQSKISRRIENDMQEEIIPAGNIFTKNLLENISDYINISSSEWTSDENTNRLVSMLLHNYKIKVRNFQGELNRHKLTLSVGDELPLGIVKLVKVYIAKKRKLQVGDKMAVRHGNKGIVSRIVRDEDLPFLEDGTPVDIVLNPLGVPSRMNMGQIYETILGWAGHKLGIKFSTPIFDGASIEQITEYTSKAGLPHLGSTYLYDGETGERFDKPTTVGIIYMLKLGHMVDDKMHARSIGPYSLITQQPLGGKAQFGGQRFGEMEVWALESFGASNILREILTVKSDDVVGRSKTYESIVKGETLPEPGIPESFNVLLHELKGLGLNLHLEE
ncbi:DNA-directed RNA polymerase subunit beta [Candidatus Walczuchella monophlebidarum]|uniref:DNA-directed RNA polymerase subunit beta n=1 Tax=Candidatus Walczuchella monophlebidarum TaxID=1415657 RepID=A0A068DWP3_9FLAO|nr:DNA-directed RNA polymerase subunit beta [Candidatus Walczuchella monophlebidarum]